MMPGMDGVETLKKIRALPGGADKTLPVVALTANATNSARAMFLRKALMISCRSPYPCSGWMSCC